MFQLDESIFIVAVSVSHGDYCRSPVSLDGLQACCGHRGHPAGVDGHSYEGDTFLDGQFPVREFRGQREIQDARGGKVHSFCQTLQVCEGGAGGGVADKVCGVAVHKVPPRSGTAVLFR